MAQFAVGLAMGALASLAISFGLIASFLAIVFIGAFAAVWRSLPALAGGWLAIGAIWLTLLLNAEGRCQATDSCGSAHVALLSVSVALVAIGTATAGLAWWLNRRRSVPSP